MEIDKAISILCELKKGGHGGFDGVTALTLGIEALKHYQNPRDLVHLDKVNEILERMTEKGEG